MEYIDVQWMQESPDHPFRLVSELDTQRYEIRKLEFFSDGRVGFASSVGRSPSTDLGSVAVPSLDEINQSEEFIGTTITATVFESLWATYTLASA